MGVVRVIQVSCDAADCPSSPMVTRPGDSPSALDNAATGRGWVEFVWMQGRGDRGIPRTVRTIYCPGHAEVLRGLVPPGFLPSPPESSPPESKEEAP